jgi:copper transport protein
MVALVALFLSGWDAAPRMQPRRGALVTAQPAANALLADAPARILLTFSEPVDRESSRIRLLGAGGVEIALEPEPEDPGNASQIVARPARILGGDDYMVVWSARTASDGALLAGAYPFRSGVIENLGAAQLAWQWPAPWASLLRALVFLGTALAAGGFGWSRLLASGSGARRPASFLRSGAMAAGALIALLATLLPPLLQPVISQSGEGAATVTAALRAMPLGWWLQLIALAALFMLCLATLAGGRRSSPAAASLDWVGLAVGLAALVGLSFTSHGASSRDGLALTLEVLHQWSAALWFAALLYLVAEWRALGPDIARFRTVRWIGGALIAVSVLSGLAMATPLFPSFLSVFVTRYGQVLAGKGLFVFAILVLGLLAMVVPRRTSARRAGGSLTAQGLLGLVVTLFAAVLALMAAPGIVAPATLAGIDLVDVVPLDSDVFGVDSGLVHLMTQPGRAGPQTLVVRLTSDDGAPLVPDPTPNVEVIWTPLTNPASAEVIARLEADSSGSLFVGAANLAVSSWWRADVVITPPAGITSRAQFWLMLPDPATTGRGLEPASDQQARELYERGLASLTSLRSVRISQRLSDGNGALERSRAEIRAEEPAAFAGMTIDAAGNAVSQQRIIGDRRWVLAREEGWQAAEPQPLFLPSAWAETYAGATGFQLGPREGVGGELCQIVTFWRPSQQSTRDPAWFAWWVGLASGQVRREATISPGQYVVRNFSDFNTPLEISAPATAAPLATPATPALPLSTPLATPIG